MTSANRRFLTLSLATSIWSGLPASLHAAPTNIREFNLPTQPLASALRAVARESNLQIMMPSDAVEGRMAPSLDGRYTSEQAVELLIAGSGLSATISGETVLIRAPGKPEATKDSPSGKNEIVVTGTHIKGRSSAAPTIVKTRVALVNEGFASLPDAVRSLPQNFSGGQNPGVGVGAGGSPDNENVSSGSTINLRGVGQDATLTLLNGHRIAYDVASQGVDVSIIPLAALDRIEVVTDGASALYGSDAVAGVANIILRRDYQGASLSARVGAATDGGAVQQQYGIVAGHRWGNGGFIATYDFERDTAIEAGDRDYTRTSYSGQTLLPYERRHAVVANGHQSLSDNLTFSIDGGFNERWSNLNVPLTSTANYRISGVRQTSRTIAFSIAPSLSWAIGSDWTVSATGVYGLDRSHYNANVYSSGQVINPSAGCYCNDFTSAEAGIEGPVTHLGGGDVRIAMGGGVRRNGLQAFRTAGDPLSVAVHQSTDFAYGEISVPLVSPNQNLSLIHRLALSGAVRWERYPGVDSVTTPRFSAVYAPASWIDLLGTWGRSFKAPTLYQRYATTFSMLYPATTAGGVGYPANATVVELTGANPNLRPEHTKSWTAGAVIRPASHLSIRIDTFHIDYRDRVVQPIVNLSSALATSAFAALIEKEPSGAEAMAAIDPTRYDFENLTNAPPNPALIAAIIDNRYQNIARQKIRGVDASLNWHRATSSLGSFDIEIAVSRLHSDEALIPTAAPLALAGTIFNPPHWRGRGGVVWKMGDFSIAAYGNYTGPVRDNRSAPIARVASMSTADLTLHYRTRPGDTPLAGLDVVLAVQNLFNASPARIRTSAPFLLPYDSTNYSAVGRFVGLTVTKNVL